MKPPEASTNAVALPVAGGAGSAGSVPLICDGPGFPTASHPVSRQFDAPTPDPVGPPNTTGMAAFNVTLLTAMTPMLLTPPGVPAVVNAAAPVSNAGSVNRIVCPIPITAPATGLAPSVGVLIVAETPGTTNAIVVVGSMVPEGPATEYPTSSGVEVTHQGRRARGVGHPGDLSTGASGRPDRYRSECVGVVEGSRRSAVGRPDDEVGRDAERSW